MKRGTRIIGAAILAFVSFGSGPATAASWSTYYSTATKLPVYAYWGESAVLNIAGHGIRNCSSGFTARIMIMNSGYHQQHLVSFNSSMCAGSYEVAFGHTDNSYRAYCTNVSGGSEYANCRVNG